MNLLHYLQTRRSVPVKCLREPGPSKTDIDTMLAIAARVPDHGALHPWRFILFEGEQRQKAGDGLELILMRGGQIDPVQLEKTRTAFTLAPLVVAVVSTARHTAKIPKWEQELSAGAVCLNLIHAAHALGFAATWLTRWYAYNEEALEFFGVQKDEQLAGFIHIGTPTEKTPERPRPNLAEHVSYWQEAGR